MQITLTDYDALKEVIQHFQKGIYEILIIEGNAGTGKSQIVKQTFKDKQNHEYCWLEGRTSAAAFYEILYQYIDCPIILDDADMFITDKQCLNLLKTLCQTDKDKRVQWLTLRKLPEGMPTQFDTSSTVILITNQWRAMSKHLTAVQDRGLYVTFNPSGAAIHAYAHSLCCLEVWQFFDMFLPHIRDLSLRQYVIAQRMHDHRLPWRLAVIQSWGLSLLERCYIEIEINYPELQDHERKSTFLSLTGKNTQTYERIKRKLMSR